MPMGTVQAAAYKLLAGQEGRPCCRFADSTWVLANTLCLEHSASFWVSDTV